MPPGVSADAKPYLFKDEEGVEHDLRQRLQNAQRSAKQWETQRDHAAVLELPSNLEQLAPEKRTIVRWLKRQHKKLARKWHPDKARGNKERAARKMPRTRRKRRLARSPSRLISPSAAPQHARAAASASA